MAMRTDRWARSPTSCTTMEYGPSPEKRRRRARLARGAQAPASAISSAARFTKPGELFDVPNPATGEPLAARHAGRGGRRRRRRRRRAQGAACAGRRCRAMNGRAISMRSRGMSRSASGSSPCSKAIDNGKPIRETRDIDMPLVARHFYHHAGWAALIDTRISGRSGRSASAGRSFRGISRC